MTTAVTWKNLKQEFSKNSGPGTLWYEEVKKIARSKARSLKARKVPPSVYGFTDWDFEDLVQEVFTERLIGRSQAEYIFDHAADLEHCRALLANEVSYTLEKKRVPNQLNNVWDNLQPRLEKLGWAPTTSDIDDQVVKRLKLIVLNLKRLRNKGQLRFSALFAPAQLDILAQTIMADFPLASKSTLFQALREAFTIISPAVSVHVVGDSSEAEKFGLDVDPEGENLFSEDADKYSELHLTIANEICEKVGVEGQEIMFHEAAGSTQSEIAAALGTYRAKVKEQVEAMHIKLEGIFDDLKIDEPDKVQVLGAILWILGADGIKNGKLQRKNQPENEGQANEE
jgi:hypothetical protein